MSQGGPGLRFWQTGLVHGSNSSPPSPASLLIPCPHCPPLPNFCHLMLSVTLGTSHLWPHCLLLRTLHPIAFVFWFLTTRPPHPALLCWEGAAGQRASVLPVGPFPICSVTPKHIIAFAWYLDAPLHDLSATDRGCIAFAPCSPHHVWHNRFLDQS